MTAVDSARALLRDSFGRVHDLITDLTDGLTDEVATYRPDAGANPIVWLLWHTSRVQDDHVAGLAGVEQVWPGWQDRFDLPLADTDIGYGHTAAEVAVVRAEPALLAGYHAEVHAATLRYLDDLSDEELARVVDDRWDPPVTASVRLVSVIGDALQHLGQAAYLRGLADRAGSR